MTPPERKQRPIRFVTLDGTPALISIRIFVLTFLLACSLPAQAQFPSKPVRAIVAFGTGGATNVIARIVAASMSQSLGQPVVIDDRPGADGIVAGEQLVKAGPDR